MEDFKRRGKFRFPFSVCVKQFNALRVDIDGTNQMQELKIGSNASARNIPLREIISAHVFMSNLRFQTYLYV